MRPLVAQGIWLLEDEEEQFICSSVRASRTVLPPSGIMVGTYQMTTVGDPEEQFDIDVPAFSLDSPYDKAN